MHFLRDLYREKFEVDNRDPLITFSFGQNEYGVKAPSLLWWTQFLVFIGVTASAYLIVWAVTYYCYVSKHSSHNQSLLFGYGVLLPLIPAIPYMFASYLDIRNTFQRYAVVTMYPVLTWFKTMEAMHNFVPKGVDESFERYAIYNATVLELEFDKNHNYRVASGSDKKMALIRFSKQYVILGLYLSFLSCFDYQVFDYDVDANIHGFALEHLMNANLFLDNIMMTILFQQTLTVFMMMLAILATAILGVKVSEGMVNPVFTASSPSDFWGRKWNLVIHGALKRGVFKPVYKISSRKYVAVIAAFVASGLFHEYTLLACFPSHIQAGTPAIGMQTKFMAWNAFIVSMENLVGHFMLFQWMKKNLAAPIVTFLVLSIAMPIAHWFIHPLSKTKIFYQMEIAFPILYRISE